MLQLYALLPWIYEIYTIISEILPECHFKAGAKNKEVVVSEPAMLRPGIYRDLYIVNGIMCVHVRVCVYGLGAVRRENELAAGNAHACVYLSVPSYHLDGRIAKWTGPWQLAWMQCGAFACSIDIVDIVF